MLDLQIIEMVNPVAAQVKISYEHGPFEVQFHSHWNHLKDDNGKQFFADAKKSLTHVAVSLADMQDKLMEADRKDQEAAIRKYLANTTSSYRTVSLATAQLVYGLTITDRDRQEGSVLIDLADFDVAVGKAQNRLGYDKLFTAKDYRINFLNVDPFSQKNSNGTKYILENLHMCAQQIEDWYFNMFPGKTGRGALMTANQADGRGEPIKIEPDQKVNEFEKRFKERVKQEQAIAPKFQEEAVKQHLIVPKKLLEPAPHDPVTQINAKIRSGEIRVPVRKDDIDDELTKAITEHISNMQIKIPENPDRQVFLGGGYLNIIPEPDPFAEWHTPEEKVHGSIENLNHNVIVGEISSPAFVVYQSGLGDVIAPLDDMNFVKTDRQGKTILEITQAEVAIDKLQVIEEIVLASSSRSKNAKNPAYWAHAVEDKVNGILQQAKQNLPEGDATRDLITAISNLLSDHIYAMGKEEEPSQ